MSNKRFTKKPNTADTEAGTSATTAVLDAPDSYLNELPPLLGWEDTEAETQESDDVELTANTEPLTTDKLLPIKAIGRSCIALDNGRVASVIKIEGQDVKLLSQLEKQAYVRRLANLFNTMNGAFSFYCHSRPRNMRPYLERLDKKRVAETNPSLREQYWVESDHIRDLNAVGNLTRRDYYVTVQATPADLKSNLAADDTDEKKLSLWQLIKNRLGQALLGKEPQENIPLGEQNGPLHAKTTGDGAISPVLADSLSFRAQSFADQSRMRGKVLNSDEISQLLGEMFYSPLVNRASLDPLLKIGGAELVEEADYLKLGDTYIATLYVTDFPKTLRLGNLLEVVRFKDIQLNLAVHAEPISNERAERKLKSRQQILYAVAANDQTQAGDMTRAYKLESMAQLRSTIARGEARLFSAGIRIAVSATSRKRLVSDLRRVAQRLSEMGFGVATATRNQRRAFFSAIPLGHDWLASEKFIADRTLHPNLTGENLACLLPNCVGDFTRQQGIIQGIARADGGLVMVDRWHEVNPHTIICATSGSGKTVSMEIEILREALENQQTECFYIDPQGVLGNFARLVGGTVLDLGPKGKVVINPMDKYVLAGREEELSERLGFVRPLIELMLRYEMSATEKSAFTRALKRLYYHFEDGESMLPILEASFTTQNLYAALRPSLRDWQDDQGQWQAGVMTKLAKIYARLKAKYNIPSTGLVRGRKGADSPAHPICHLVGKRYYYRGEGETNAAFIEADYLPGQAVPPAVWYPDRDWLRELSAEFSQLVLEENVFGNLDTIARDAAIRDAFVELKLGMPILEDLMPFLAAEGVPNMVSNLEPFCDMAVYGRLFNGYTNVELNKRLVVFNVRDLDDNLLKSIRIFQVINYTWGMVRGRKVEGWPVIPVLFMVDEFGVLVETFADVASYVSTLFKRGRAFGLAMTAIVQNISSLLDYPAARECVENAERVILMRQQKTAIPRLRSHFGLTDGQCEALLNAVPGEALQRINERWVQFKYSIPTKHLALFDTRPNAEAEIAEAA